jgi:hypothetical protein
MFTILASNARLGAGKVEIHPNVCSLYPLGWCGAGPSLCRRKTAGANEAPS